MSIEDLESRLVGDFAGVGVVTAQDVVDSGGMGILLGRLAARLDDVLQFR